MKVKSLLLMSAVGMVLAGCGSGDVNLGVSTIDNSTGGGGGGGPGGVNPCAAYTTPSNEARQGAWDGQNCTYNATFVGETNPLTQSITIPFIEGTHIFEDSLFVGQDVDTGAAPAEGTGPTLTIAAGNTIAFTATNDYLRINRGSKIIAQGTAAKPITLTGYTDAVTGTAGPEDVQLWGGLVINGNGITNNCTDAQRQANQCHVLSEGKPSHYGGSSNTESSGILRYVVIKHPGFAVAPDDELNGITFNAVGSGTIVENVEVYSSYDDGIEFFGGAVNVRNYVALYVRDDSIDFSDGWVGKIENALVIHSRTDANWCVEGDNTNSSRGVGVTETPPISNPTIQNLTCITSQSPAATHGSPSRGALIRQGARAQIVDSIFYAGYGQLINPATQCFEIAGDTAKAAAAAGSSSMDTTILACQTPTAGSFANTDTVRQWVEGANPSTNGANYSFNVGNFIDAAPTTSNIAVLEPNSFYTAPTMGAGIPALPSGRTYGAVTRASDWTAGWTYGLSSTNRGQPLWFE